MFSFDGPVKNEAAQDPRGKTESEIGKPSRSLNQRWIAIPSATDCMSASLAKAIEFAKG
ncbi:hypothetical protein [Bosea sp. NPDC055594]